jgi:hypothetical protein
MILYFKSRIAAVTMLLLVFGFFSIQATAEHAPLSRSERAEILESRLLDVDMKMQDKLKRDPDPVEIRDITNGAMVALTSGNAPVAEKLLRLAYDQQDMHPGATFGEMPWNLHTRDVHDANAIDFATQSLGPILMGHSKQLSSAFLEYIRPHAAASLVALARQPVLVSYSNIYVMNFTNTILIAEFLHDDAMTKLGHQHLDAWLDYTGANGIHEFDSPTYNAVVMSSLYMGNQFSASAEVREKYRHALDYLWTDLTANYFPGAKKIAGAHSRDYDFLYGQGSIDAYFFIEDFQDDIAFNLSLERAFLLESTREGGYRSPLKHFGNETNRVITQRWDENLQKYRYTYITPNFAMGAANGQYGPQDKMFAVDFAGAMPGKKNKPIPNIFLATTTTGIPYGKDRTLDRSGHSKPKHLTNGLAAVQEKGFALLLADADPKSDKKSETFYVDMVFPAVGDLTVNGEPVSVSTKLNHSIKAGDIIGLRVSSACFALKPFGNLGPMTGQALKADEDGLSNGALRLSTSFQSVTHNEPMRSAYLAYAESCKGEGNSASTRLQRAQVKTTAMPHIWTVEAALGETVLTIDYNPDDHASIRTKVNGADFKTAPLHVIELKETAIKQ